MTTLVLIRHGQTDWNIAGRWQGQADVFLNPTGRHQAAEMARALAPTGIQAIYSSDLSRAAETALALARQTDLAVQFDPRLREIHQGEWQGLLVDEIQARYGRRFHERQNDPLNIAPPGGETVLQVQSRVLAAVQDILTRHTCDRVALVSHGFALAVIRARYAGLPVEQVWDLIPANDERHELILPQLDS